MSSKNDQANANKLQSTNWKGSIPITLSLAPSSLSSPIMPPPLHRMVSRQTYLHIALEEEVRRFHEYAPVVSFRSIKQSVNEDSYNQDNEKRKEDIDDVGGANNTDDNTSNSADNEIKSSNENQNYNSSYPMCWFEDEETGTALRWQFFTGILYDLFKLRKKHSSSFSRCSVLPWKIRVHFTSYPQSLLSLHNEVQLGIFQFYLNSLKEALYVQHNSNKVVKNMTKQSHLQIWDGIKRCQWEVYKEVSNGFNTSVSGEGIVLQSIPVRVVVDSRPIFARPCNQYHDDDDDKSVVTIGEMLRKWLPELFPDSTRSNDDENDKRKDSEVTKCVWCVQGIQVPLDTPIGNLWIGLCHPDHFLYIVIVTNTACE
mmetsp:Transcript_24296/g.29888  ORF Transcript_24296/g.29888 Transcript_24296/m.29888 type:complete len:370 (+) Transcript_24296:122-1231(+)